MSLVYRKARAKYGRFFFDYYVEADALMSEPDLKDKLASLVTMDIIKECDFSDINEEDELDIEFEDINEDLFFEETLCREYGTLRQELTVSMLLDPTDIIYSFIRVSKKPMSDKYALLVAAQCDQESDVDYIGVVGADGATYQEVVKEGQKDCLMQLKRYFSMDGVSLRRVLLAVAVIPPDEYEDMRKERELALAI